MWPHPKTSATPSACAAHLEASTENLRKCCGLNRNLNKSGGLNRTPHQIWSLNRKLQQRISQSLIKPCQALANSAHARCLPDGFRVYFGVFASLKLCNENFSTSGSLNRTPHQLLLPKQKTSANLEASTENPSQFGASNKNLSTFLGLNPTPQQIWRPQTKTSANSCATQKTSAHLDASMALS